MKHLKKIIFVGLLVIFAVNLIFRIAGYSKEYTKHFDAGYWKNRYQHSQWVVSGSKNPIGDDGLYAYVGWEYIHGSNPALLNAEIPPLGKYIIGLGEVVFQNQNILILLIGLSCLGVLYLLNINLFKDKLIAFLPVFVFSFDPLFYSQLRAPYLDTIYLLFLLLTLLSTVQKKYILASLMLGCFASVKFPAGSLFLLAPLGVWVFLFDKKHMKRFLVSLILWPGVFLFSYTMYFVLGGTPLGFLGVQKWIVHFYATGVKAAYGAVFPMILFGNWYTWFAGKIHISEWNILWAISFIGSIFAVIPLGSSMFNIHNSRSKIKDPRMSLILLWTISYLVFLTFTPVFPRYLLLLLPFMYNLTIWFLVKYVFPRF